MPRPKSEKFIKRFLRWGFKLFFKFVVFLVFISSIQVLLVRFLDPPFTAQMAWAWFQGTLHSKNYKKSSFYWKKLDTISPHLIKAVQAGEDQRFLTHHGFDFIEMNQAILDILNAKRIRGASTITMQAARTVFLWPERSWLRKIAEAYYTALIELFWSKKRILEVYLNTVDWGAGIIGAEAASKKYFYTDSSDITPSQSAILVAILPSPHKWSPINPTRYVRERQKKIMRDMEKMPTL